MILFPNKVTFSDTGGRTSIYEWGRDTIQPITGFLPSFLPMYFSYICNFPSASLAVHRSWALSQMDHLESRYWSLVTWFTKHSSLESCHYALSTRSDPPGKQCWSRKRSGMAWKLFSVLWPLSSPLFWSPFCRQVSALHLSLFLNVFFTYSYTLSSDSSVQAVSL